MLDDTSYMQHALGLARRQLGITWPNPAVGAVIVKDSTILGRGATAKGGRPHAETQAIAQAGKSAKGATLYVTLEPCSHHGKTPPCAEAVIAAGITRVIIGCTDPNPNVSGGGIAALKAANIDVLHGICEAEAKEINAGFFKQITRGIPLIAIKIATTLDGNIATGQGESQWITGNEARRFGHLLRAQYDAILPAAAR
jgi:diaminohydroxyphosphoribosylaminopyrimidine deaminase/5-amino-6-(5-phosphoribosylamino)uracil reductase